MCHRGRSPQVRSGSSSTQARTHARTRRANARTRRTHERTHARTHTRTHTRTHPLIPSPPPPLPSSPATILLRQATEAKLEHARAQLDTVSSQACHAVRLNPRPHLLLKPSNFNARIEHANMLHTPPRPPPATGAVTHRLSTRPTCCGNVLNRQRAYSTFRPPRSYPLCRQLHCDPKSVGSTSGHQPRQLGPMQLASPTAMVSSSPLRPWRRLARPMHATSRVCDGRHCRL